MVIKFILEEAKKYKKDVFWGSLFLIVTNIIGVTIPLKIKSTIDNLVATDFAWDTTVLWNIVLIIFIALFMAGTRILSRIFIFGIGRKVESNKKQEFYSHLLKLDSLYFSTQRIGDLISRSTNDIQAIRQMMGFGLMNIINIAWMYALTLPILFSLAPSLTVWLLIGYTPILYFAKLLSNKLKTLQITNQEELGKLSSFIEEDLNGIQVIKAYSQEEREKERFQKTNKDFLNIAEQLTKVRSLVWPVLGMTRTVSFIVVIIYINQGWIGVGTIAAVLIYLERLVFPTAIMGWLITIFQKGSISIKRINEILDKEPQIINHSEKELSIEIGNIEIKDLNYSYNSESLSEGSNKEFSLNSISCNIPGGKFTGIVGKIGSGKSTLVKLITRVLNAPKDSIYIDRQDIYNVTIESLRERIALVSQEQFMFNASIINNLTLFQSYPIEEIRKVCNICQIDDEINNFENGYETIIGEKGVNVSGGQAQRLSIARALLHNPQILILDHSLSSIDNETSLKILESIKEEYQNITILLITHRVQSLQTADQILEIKNGEIKTIKEESLSNL